MRGILFPDLERKVSWLDSDTTSTAEVHAFSCGTVSLIVSLTSTGWIWEAIGWLGVRFGGGEAASRSLAKRAAISWWGSMTTADRLNLAQDA